MWPAAAPAGMMILLVDAAEHGAPVHGEYISRSISEALGIVSLNAACGGPADAATAIDWTADHAAQLGADGSRLLLAGLHGGAALAAALAIGARDSGWPDVARQVLIHPRFGSTTRSRLAGVAPATIVARDAISRTYATRLRRAGVDVDELDLPDPFRQPVAPRDSADGVMRRITDSLME